MSKGWYLGLLLMNGWPAAHAVSRLPAPSPKLGTPLTEIEARAIDLTIMPDGAGLPPGSGDVQQGSQVFATRCESCHGPAGAGGPGLQRLTGGVGSLATQQPVKTVNSFWPFAPLVFDYIRRAMPLTAPQSLTANDIYAVVAYLLSVDHIVPGSAQLDSTSLASVQMPNRKGFVPVFPMQVRDLRSRQ